MAKPPEEVLQDFLTETETARQQASNEIRNVASSANAKQLSDALTSATTKLTSLGQASLEVFRELKLLKESEITAKNTEIAEKNKRITELEAQLANATPAAPTADDIVQALVQNQQFADMFSGLATSSKLDALANTVGALPSQQSLTTAINAITPTQPTATDDSTVSQTLASIPDQIISGVANHLSLCGINASPALPDGFQEQHMRDFLHRDAEAEVRVIGLPSALTMLQTMVNKGGRVKVATAHGSRSGFVALAASLKNLTPDHDINAEDLEKIFSDARFDKICKEYAKTKHALFTPEYTDLLAKLTATDAGLYGVAMQMLLAKIEAGVGAKFRLVIVGHYKNLNTFRVDIVPALTPEAEHVDATAVFVEAELDSPAANGYVAVDFTESYLWSGISAVKEKKRTESRAQLSPTPVQDVEPKKTRNPSGQSVSTTKRTRKGSNLTINEPSFAKATKSSVRRQASGASMMSISSQYSAATETVDPASTPPSQKPSRRRRLVSAGMSALKKGKKTSEVSEVVDDNTKIIALLTPAVHYGKFGLGRPLDIGSDPDDVENADYLHTRLAGYLGSRSNRAKALKARDKPALKDMQCVWTSQAKQGQATFDAEDTICSHCRNPPDGRDTKVNRQCAILMDEKTLLVKGLRGDWQRQQERLSPEGDRYTPAPVITLNSADEMSSS